jgi:hypothetical protein
VVSNNRFDASGDVELTPEKYEAMQRRWAAEKRSVLSAFLAEPPLNVAQVCEFLRGPYGGGSHERSQAVVAWADAVQGEEAGRVFWAVIQNEWSSFDRIPHDAFRRLFVKFSSEWVATDEINRLPDLLIVYRGQSGDDPPGLSWTRDRAVAETFARGHRGIAVPNSTILERRIDREDVALVVDDRGEQEIVLWR